MKNEMTLEKAYYFKKLGICPGEADSYDVIEAMGYINGYKQAIFMLQALIKDLEEEFK